MTKETSLSFTNHEDKTVFELIVGTGATGITLMVSDINVIGDDEDVLTEVAQVSLTKRDLVRISNFITGELDNV